MRKSIWQNTIIQILFKIVKILVIFFAVIWIGGQMFGVFFFGPASDLIELIMGDEFSSAIFSDDYSSESDIAIVRGLGAIFDTAYYAIYTLISIIAAIFGTIILSKKRNIYEILGMLAAFMIPNERRSWGLVRDKATRRPIPFAVIRLTEMGPDIGKSESKVANVLQTVSDLDGRYRLYVNPAIQYRISVHAAGYIDITRDLDIHEDPTKSNLFVENLYLSKLSKEESGLTTGLNYLRPKFYWYLIVSFYVLALFYLLTAILYVAAFPESVYGIVQLALFAIAFIWNTKILWERTHANRGYLIDVGSKLRLANISVDLFSNEAQITNAISDSSGLVKFDVNPGKYQLRLASNVYKFENKQDFLTVLVDNDGYINKNISIIPQAHSKTDSKTKSGEPFNDEDNPFS